jgi:hypothetical protein
MPTLEQLEGEVWPAPDFHTNLIDTCHRLRKKDVNQLAPGELRILIGQKIGLRFLVPRAMDFLDDEPLMEASFFAGDLLEAVIAGDPALYQGKPEIHNRLRTIARRLATISESDLADIKLSHRIAEFTKKYAT